MIEVFGGKAAYSNFWGGMDEEVSARECMIDLKYTNNFNCSGFL